MLSDHKEVQLKLDQLEKKITGHDADIQVIFGALKQLLGPPPVTRTRIGYRGRVEYD